MSESTATSIVLTEVAGVAEEWDGCKDIRERMKRVGRIMVDKPEQGTSEKAGTEVLLRTMDNVKYNAKALLPLARRLAGHPDKILEINALQEEIRSFYENQGLVPTVKVVSDQAWSARYLLHVLKGLMYRDKAPKDIWITLQ